MNEDHLSLTGFFLRSSKIHNLLYCITTYKVIQLSQGG
jgi:hypothetical protein